MATKNRDNLSDADLALKDEIGDLVQKLVATKLNDATAKPLLLSLVHHATSDAGNISSVPKALQFLIEHYVALDTLYKNYSESKGIESYSIVLLLEILSFLDAIDVPDRQNVKHDESSDEALIHVSCFKMLLYKIEANLIAGRMIESNNLSDDDKNRLLRRSIEDWGNEYIISLSSQIVRYFSQNATRDAYTTLQNYNPAKLYTSATERSVLKKMDVMLVIIESLKMVDLMTTYWIKHGFEYDAIDILLEVDRIELIASKCGDDYDVITRITMYLLAVAAYAATPIESSRILNTAFELYFRNERSAEALRIAFKLNDIKKIESVILSCKNANVRKQCALMCASNGIHLNYTKNILENKNYSVTESELETLNNLSSGEYRSTFFLILGKELDVLEPKHPSDIFKNYPSTKNNLGLSSQIDQVATGISLDSANENLSQSFVNAFVNCGFGTDKLISPENSNWVYKHQEYGLLCAAASVGMLNLWNINEGLSQIDKFQYSTDKFVRAGSFAAFGLASCAVVSESDPVSGLLLEKLDSKCPVEKLGAILGLGFGYAGSCRESLLELLIPCIIDDSPTNTLECSVFSAISVALIFVGTGNQEAAEAIMQTVLEKEIGESSTSSSLDSPLSYLYACALGLLQMGRMDSCEAVLEALTAIQHPFGKFALVAVESFAYAGSGDVLRIQKLLKCCAAADESNKLDEVSSNQSKEAMDIDSPIHQFREKKSNKVGYTSDGQEMFEPNVGSVEASMAILGIPLISLSEPVGCAMILRLLDHPQQCGSIFERKAIPLALALTSVSNANPQVIDILSKLTHDVDNDVSLHAVFALGIVGCGTNNSRIGVLLQNIARNHVRNPLFTFIIRVAAGLLYMGKGTTTISPIHSDGLLLNKVSLGGLMVVLISALNLKCTLYDKMPYLLLFVALAIRPRWLIVVNPEMEHLQIPVRVGNSIDTTGTAGKPRRISGFQTHQTPVLVGSSERAELANEEYIACTSILEDIVIVEKNTEENME